MKKNWVMTMLMMTILLTSAEAWAHRPIGIGGEIGMNADQSIFVDDIAVSQVAYRDISSDMPQLWMTFEAQAGQRLSAQLGIPAIESLENYRPSMALVGPGLPQTALPFETPQGLGAMVLDSSTQETEFFYEPFTDTNSWILGNLELILPASGQYYLVAYHPEGVEGKLWMALGTLERFGAGDVGKMAEWLKSVREFHEVEGQAPLINTTYMVMAGLLVVASLITWSVLRK